MKSAFFIHYTDLYGANRSLLNLIDGLKEYNVIPHVVAPAEGDTTAFLREQKIPIAIIPIKWWLSNRKQSNNPLTQGYRYLYRHARTISRLYKNIRVLPALTAQLKLWNIDVVYTNSSAIAMGAMAAGLMRYPHVWHLREFGDLDYGLHCDWGSIARKYLFNKAAALIAISESLRSYLLADVPSNKTHVIYNGIASVAEFDRLHQIATSAPRENKPYTFALIGRIDPAKRQDTAIRALALLADVFPKTRLLIVGKGAVDPLKKLAVDLGISKNVEFWGHIADPYEAYFNSDALLMCSEFEAMGRVTVEAMAACRPVIGFDRAGTSEIIEHKTTGLLYRGGHEALAQCMKRFVENPNWGRQLGEHGWEVARKKYSIEEYAQKVYQVLMSVTDCK
jgi:glycosyltransferase involved in cell wall biosynthesis